MVNNSHKPYTFDRVVRIIITLAIIAGIILLLNRLKSVILPFLVAWLIAYMLNPIVEWNQRTLRIKKRTVSIFATFGELLIALTLIGVIVIPMIINETQHLYRLLTVYVKSTDLIPYLPVALQDFLRQNITLDHLSKLLSPEQWSELGRNIWMQIQNVISTSVHGVATIFSWSIVILYVFFILIDYDNIADRFGQLVPHNYRPIASKIAGDMKESMNRYFRGQALIATIVGLSHCVGFLIIGLPMAIPMGILVGILNLVPYMQILSYIPALLLCIIGAADGGANFWVLGGLTILVFIVCQILQDGFLIPRIMGNVTGLNPALILLSLSIWGSLLGFVGLIIALPLTTLLLSYYQRYIIDKKPLYKSDNTTDTKLDV